MPQIYFIWSNTLHVSDGLSAHHQEFTTVHTVKGICQTDTADSLQYLFVNFTNYVKTLKHFIIQQMHKYIIRRYN